MIETESGDSFSSWTHMMACKFSKNPFSILEIFETRIFLAKRFISRTFLRASVNIGISFEAIQRLASERRKFSEARSEDNVTRWILWKLWARTGRD